MHDGRHPLGPESLRQSGSPPCTTTNPVLGRRCHRSAPQRRLPFRGPRPLRSGELDRRPSQLRTVPPLAHWLGQRQVPTYRSPAAWQSVLVVAKNLIGAAVVQDRIAGAPLANGSEFVAQAWRSGLSALADQPLPKSVDHGFSQALPSRLS